MPDPTGDLARQYADNARRIAVVLADLDQVRTVDVFGTHGPHCWMDRRHGHCLAARIRRTLTEEAP